MCQVTKFNFPEKYVLLCLDIFRVRHHIPEDLFYLMDLCVDTESVG